LFSRLGERPSGKNAPPGSETGGKVEDQGAVLSRVVAMVSHTGSNSVELRMPSY
jgi:hypothetical protein